MTSEGAQCESKPGSRGMWQRLAIREPPPHKPTPKPRMHGWRRSHARRGFHSLVHTQSRCSCFHWQTTSQVPDVPGVCPCTSSTLSRAFCFVVSAEASSIPNARNELPCSMLPSWLLECGIGFCEHRGHITTYVG